MKVFISYSRHDEGAVRSLVGDLQRAPVQVWLDEELGGGAAWWTAILKEIRECTVFLFALSNNSLNSKPCRAELGYAQALGLPILPVQVGEISSFRADPIFSRQLIDYRKPTAATGFALMGALNEHAAQRADLPDPLPDAPPIPYEYLQRLGASIRDPAILTPPVQAQMLFELRNALHDEDDPTVLDDIRNLLRTLRRRSDITYPIASEIDTILGKDAPDSSQTPAESRPENALTVGGQRPDTLAPAAAPASPPADAPSESAASRVASYWRNHRLLLGVVAVVILGVVFALVDRATTSAPDPSNSPEPKTQSGNSTSSIISPWPDRQSGNSTSSIISPQPKTELFSSSFSIGVEKCDPPPKQLCTPIPSREFPTGGLLTVQFTLGTNGCSDMIAHVIVDGREWGSDRIGPDKTRTRPFMNPVASGTHTVGVQAEGIVGGCNTGSLGSWDGTLSIMAA